MTRGALILCLALASGCASSTTPGDVDLDPGVEDQAAEPVLTEHRDTLGATYCLLCDEAFATCRPQGLCDGSRHAVECPADEIQTVNLNPGGHLPSLVIGCDNAGRRAFARPIACESRSDCLPLEALGGPGIECRSGLCLRPSVEVTSTEVAIYCLQDSPRRSEFEGWLEDEVYGRALANLAEVCDINGCRLPTSCVGF